MGKRKGFTLVEIMVTLLVFATTVVVLVGVYLGIAQLRESGRNLSRAMADAQICLEVMRDASAVGLTAVTSTDWTAWASANGLVSLENETVTVTTENPAADPLDLTVRVDWRERGRARSARVNTLMTKR